MKIQKVDDGVNTLNEPGAYDLPAGRYHADPCPEPALSSSLGRVLLAQSPRHAWHAHPRLNPNWRPDPEGGDRRMALGTACHHLLLGEGSKLCHLMDFSDYRKKAAQEMRDTAIAEGLVPILAPDWETAQQIVAEARIQLADYGSELVELLGEGGATETTVIARDEHTGVWTRSLLDWWSGDGRTLVDYKTTEGSAAPAAFARHAAGMGYDFQGGFYGRVVEAAFPELAGRTRFLFIAQEIDPPYGLTVNLASRGDLHMADQKVQAALEIWARCLELKMWPGYPARVVPMELPGWYASQWLDLEQEMEEAGGPGDWVFAQGGNGDA